MLPQAGSSQSVGSHLWVVTAIMIVVIAPAAAFISDHALAAMFLPIAIALIVGGVAFLLIERRLKGHFGSDSGVTIFCVPNELTRVTVKIPLETRSS